MSATVKARDLNNLDTFEYQNELCHLLRQDDADILQEIDVVDKQQICDNGVTKINYKFKPLHEGYVYFRMQGNVGTAGVRVNGEELREYYVQNQWNIGRIYVNDCSGDVNVNIEVDSEQCNLDELAFYQQNDDVFESTMNMLKQKAVSVTKKVIACHLIQLFRRMETGCCSLFRLIVIGNAMWMVKKCLWKKCMEDLRQLQ